MKIRGVNKKKGTKRRMGKIWRDRYGRKWGYLLCGSVSKGTIKHRLMWYCSEDSEWWPSGKWKRGEPI